MKLFRKQYHNICIEAQVIEAGNDLCVIVTGGKKPHIGSVSISIPRESLSNSMRQSATTSTYNFVGHKDDIIGNKFSHKLASTLGKKVIVTCGIHFDEITDEQMSVILSLSEKLLLDILDNFTSEK